MVWQTGDILGPTNLNDKSASATSSAGFSTNTISPESGSTTRLTGHLRVDGVSRVSANFTGTLFDVQRNSSSALQVQSTGSENNITLMPPLDDTRMKIQFGRFASSSATGLDTTTRPYSIEVHGSQDSDAPVNHATHYILDGTTERKMFEMYWGSQFTGALHTDAISAFMFASNSGLTVKPSTSTWTGASNIILLSDGSAANTLGFRADGRLRSTTTPSGAVAYSALLSGDAAERIQIQNVGKILWGNGTNAAEVSLTRSATSTLAFSGGTFDMRGGALSIRTTTSNASSSNLTIGEICLVAVSVTSAQLAIRSGNTTYVFNAVQATP